VTSTPDLHCPELEQVGVYVLGALEPDEREAYEAHLETCDECREEYEKLAHLPAMLDLVAPVPVLAPLLPAAPAGGEERLVANLRGASRRRRRRTALLAAGTALAGAAAAAVAILGFGVGSGSDNPPTPTIALAPTALAASGNAWATAKLHNRAAGSVVDFEAGGLPVSTGGDRYVVYVRENGKTVAKATFTVDTDGWGQVAMTTVEKIYPDAQLEVRKDVPGEPLVMKSSA
jgi:anti-sigma-K factor RskA